MAKLSIAEVARRTGVPASTLRYYEEKHLVSSVGRQGLQRVFESDVFERLALIALGRAAGFSLNEIAATIAPSGKVVLDRLALERRADELDLAIRRMTMMRDGLRHAAVCKAPSHMECEKFRRILSAAASRGLGSLGKRTNFDNS